MYFLIAFFIFFVNGGVQGAPDWCILNSSVEFQVFPEAPIGLQNHKLLVKIKNPTTLKDCEFFSQRENVSWTVNAGKNETGPGLYYWQDKKNNECGFLISTVKKNNVGYYRAQVTDEEGQKSQCIDVGYKDEASEPSILEISKMAGTSFTINCIGQSDDKSNLVYSKVYNPKNVIVNEGSTDSWTVSNIRKDDEGIWKCESLLVTRENIITYQVRLQVLEPSIIPEKTETDANINLRWTIPEHLSTQFEIGKCFIEKPDGTKMYLIEGVIYERYTYYGNGLAKFDCGVSIPKPLDKSEIGRWKLAIPSTSKTSKNHIGGFIDVGTSGLAPITPETKYKKIQILEGSDLSIQCSTRASLTYCYVESPYGKIYSNWDKINDKLLYTGLGLNVGDCEITIPGGMLNESDNGQWTCSMGAENIYQDLQIDIDVEISNKKFLALNTVVEANIGSSVTLICQSFMGYRLKYCRFNRPDNMGINLIKNNQTINGKYSYFGRGFEAGECGLRINNVQADDLGIWKCSASIDNVINTEEHSDALTLQERSGWSTSSLGIGVILVAVGLTVAIISVGLFLWQRRRRSQQIDHFARREGRIPDSFADQIPRERSSTHSSAELANGENIYVAYRNENYSDS